MLRHAAAAVPWARVTLAAVLVLVLMELVRRWQWTMWPLEGTAVGLLAAATAWCFDEPAASVVDTAPRSLAWRTLARSSGVLVLGTAWVLAVLLARDSLFGHPWEVGLQGMGAIVAAAAYAAWRRTAGDATPGLAAAMVVVPLATAWALIRPFAGEVPVFPYADGSGDFGSWDVSRAGWAGLVACSATLLALAISERRATLVLPVVLHHVESGNPVRLRD